VRRIREDVFTFMTMSAKCFLEWEIFQIKAVEKIKTHVLFSIASFENRAVYEIMSKNVVKPEATDDNIMRMRFACLISNSARAHAHANAHANPHARRYKHPRARIGKTEILIAFPRQQWFHVRASVLLYTYIASLVSSGATAQRGPGPPLSWDF
jgi:hypothetical protein